MQIDVFKLFALTSSCDAKPFGRICIHALIVERSQHLILQGNFPFCKQEIKRKQDISNRQKIPILVLLWREILNFKVTSHR